MRFIYADTALSNEVGHHANSCRVITGELKSRGILPEVLAFGDVTEELKREFGARAFFHCHTYWSDGDPICGWLNSFHKSSEILRGELSGLGPMANEDVIYFNSAQAAQLMGVTAWLRELEENARPHVVMEFGTEAGVDLVDGPDGPVCVARDQRGVLNRFAAQQITEGISRHLHLATFDKDSSAVYALLMGRRVGVLPLPQRIDRAPRVRGGNGVITIAVLGHQREEKGYQLLPRTAELILKSHGNVRLLVHNSKPEEMAEVQNVMRRMAAMESRIVLDERVVRGEEWSGLLDAADVMLCPYFAPRFRYGYSAVASEAIANAIPMVAPAGTTLARVMQEFGAGGTTFERFEPESVAEAVGRLLAGFSEQANRSVAGAREWARVHGPEQTVDGILAMARDAGKPR